MSQARTPPSPDPKTTDVSSTVSTTARTPAPPAPAGKVHHPWTTGGLIVLLLFALVGLATLHLDPFDADAPGTTHLAIVPLTGCGRPASINVDGRTWASHDRVPANWPNPWNGVEKIRGTLEVTAADEGVFTADMGGSVTYHRLAPHAFDTLECAVS